MRKLVFKPNANPVTQAEIVEYLRTHRPAFPRTMAYSRGPKKLVILYFRLFAEVQRLNPDLIKTSWFQVGNGQGQPAQQIGYSWVGGNTEPRVF